MLRHQESNNTTRVQRLLMLLQTLIADHDSSCSSELQQALGRSMERGFRLPATTAPACTFLPKAIASLEQSSRNTLTTAAQELAWRIPGFGHLPSQLSQHLAVSVIIGPEGGIFDERVSLGIILLAPHVNYPNHNHAAEELYLVLSGTLDWVIDSEAVGSIKAGEFVHHKPWQYHSMATGASPALLFWGWTGDIRGDSYSIQQM